MMLFTKHFSSLLILLSIFPNLVLGRAYAESLPYKVVGRGIENRKTQERLQLACIGDIKPENNERSCDKLQLLLTDRAGQSRLVFRPIKIDESEKVKKQIKSYLKKAKIDNASRFGDAKHWFQERLLGGMFSPKSGGTIPAAIIISVITLGVCCALSGGVCAASLGWPSLGFGFLFPLIGMDLIFFPVSRAFSIGSIQSVQALQDKAKPHWQFSPRKVSNRFFSKVLKVVDHKTAWTNPTHSSDTAEIVISPEALESLAVQTSVLSQDSFQEMDSPENDKILESNASLMELDLHEASEQMHGISEFRL